MKNMKLAHQLALQVQAKGGRAYFVGGYVRDLLLGKESKDLDIEVHGITPPTLEAIVDSLGERINIGESFGIFAVKGYEVDIAMPRKERLCGVHHRDFTIEVDPFLGIHKAAQRRDFTINAMLADVLTGEIIDPYGGKADLAKGILRHVHAPSFIEDALRVFRGAQFAARFAFSIAEETIALCRQIEVSHLAKERVEAELKKALLKADKPSLFFSALRSMHQVTQWFPEVEALIGVAQNPMYHGEGDVWNHTMAVVDAFVPYRSHVAQPFACMLACIAHDFGKPSCTTGEKENIHAYRHEIKGLPLAKEWVTRLTNDQKCLELVLNLTKLHMRPNALAKDNASITASNKLFDIAIDPEALIYLALADSKGRIATVPTEDTAPYLWQRLAIYRQTMQQPYVTGKDLIACGLPPTKDFSKWLAFAHTLRLAGVSKEKALKQTLAVARKS